MNQRNQFDYLLEEKQLGFLSPFDGDSYGEELDEFNLSQSPYINLSPDCSNTNAQFVGSAVATLSNSNLHPESIWKHEDGYFDSGAEEAYQPVQLNRAQIMKIGKAIGGKTNSWFNLLNGFTEPVYSIQQVEGLYARYLEYKCSSILAESVVLNMEEPNKKRPGRSCSSKRRKSIRSKAPRTRDYHEVEKVPLDYSELIEIDLNFSNDTNRYNWGIYLLQYDKPIYNAEQLQQIYDDFIETSAFDCEDKVYRIARKIGGNDERWMNIVKQIRETPLSRADLEELYVNYMSRKYKGIQLPDEEDPLINGFKFENYEYLIKK